MRYCNMDFLIPHQCWDNNASWPKCPHQSEVPQNNYLHQDLIWCLYIKALKATFDRMLHLLKEQTGDQSSDQLLSITALFPSESRYTFLFFGCYFATFLIVQKENLLKKQNNWSLLWVQKRFFFFLPIFINVIFGPGTVSVLLYWTTKS